MSNPAVLVLDSASNESQHFKRFVVEDNIGESIHVHMDNIRLDFTIKEYLDFSNLVWDSLNSMDLLCGKNVNDFDAELLKKCAPYLHNLYDIQVEKIKISKLKCISRVKIFKDLFLNRKLSISNTYPFRYIKNKDKSYGLYYGKGYKSINNIQRLNDLRESLQKQYPLQNQYIIVFNDSNIVIDGQIRLAILADMYGLEADVEVMRFYFNGSEHRSKYIARNCKNLFYWFARKIYYKYFKKN